MTQYTELSEGLFKPHRNHYLFSDYYLDHRVSALDEWQKANVQPLFEQMANLWRQFTPQPANEAQTEEDWIRPVLRALGHHFNVQVALRTPLGIRKPDYIFFTNKTAQETAKTQSSPLNEGDLHAAIAVGDAKAWELKLDQPVRTPQTVSANPNFQIDFYIRHSGLAWGVLTNGRHWRLYHHESSKRLDVYYEVDLPELILSGDVERFKYFALFFRCEAFLGEPCWLEFVLAESRAYMQGVSDNLKEQVYDALRCLSEGFLKFPENHLQPTPETLKAIYDGSLIVLYRLLFILYAESRNLLPIPANQAYTQSYSLHELKRRVVQELQDRKPAVASIAVIWQKLYQLWRIIHTGNAELDVPAYNGGLFSPEKHPFLERCRVGDLYLRKAIDLLTRTMEPSTGNKEFVDYRDLEIRHLGSIYEGLLEYQLRYATEPLTVKKARGKEMYAPAPDLQTRPAVNAGEVYLATDNGERKATGSYYTPDEIVQYIVEYTVGPVLARLREQAGDDAIAIANAVLAVNILDPAMGSGHFLVAATDFIARYLVALELKPAEIAAEDELAYWRRRIVQTCIYGVDANPLAVELAKLSLWLTTVAKDKPLSFLDHHLQCGNSLIGGRVSDLMLTMMPKQNAHYKRQEQLARQAGQMSLLQDSAFAGSMRNAHYLLGQLEALKSDTVADIQQAEQIYRKVADTVTQKARTLTDVWTARNFGATLDEKQWRSLADYLLHNGGQKFKYFDDLLDRARTIAEQYRFFHWELEFPDVFFDQHGRLLDAEAGFDAVIGNPPWGASFHPDEKEFFKTTYADIHQRTPESFNYFIYQAFSLLKQQGMVGMIIPSSFLTQHEFEKSRLYLIEQGALRRICNLGDGVFPDVTAPACILIVDKHKDALPALYVDVRHVAREQLTIDRLKNAPGVDGSSIPTNESAAFIVKQGRDLLPKCYAHPALKAIAEEVATGISTGYDRAFIYTEEQIAALALEQEVLKKLVIGGEIHRYALTPRAGKKVIYITPTTDLANYPTIQKTLLPHKKRLLKRREAANGQIPWYSLNWPRREKLFIEPKILIRQTANRILAAFDADQWYCLKSAIIVQLPDHSPIGYDYLLALLNSALFDFLYTDLVQEEIRIFPEVKPVQLFKLPIKMPDIANPDEQACYEGVVRLAQQMRTLQAERNDLDRKFITLLHSDLGIAKPGKQLAHWDVLDAQAFVQALQKQQASLTLAQKSEWIEYFEQQTALTADLNRKIAGTDKAIDQLVYALYGLTDEEIATVEARTA